MSGAAALPFSEYLALQAWGSSSLRAMRRGPPARVLWEREHERSQTEATILGTAVHCALLTPELYEKQYAIRPEGLDFRSKEGKAWRDDPVRAGLVLLSREVGNTVSAIVEALLGKDAVWDSLEAATAREASLVWNCSITDERCKARPDWMQGKWIYDLKVSRYASGNHLALRAFTEGWMHQLAHYRTGAIELGMPVQGGRLVVVDPVAPHFVYTMEVKQDALDLLEIENINTLKQLRFCRQSGNWPGTPDEWIQIEPPASANMDAMNDVQLSEEVVISE